jgi:hypothetical protein
MGTSQIDFDGFIVAQYGKFVAIIAHIRTKRLESPSLGNMGNRGQPDPYFLTYDASTAGIYRADALFRGTHPGTEIHVSMMKASQKKILQKSNLFILTIFRHLMECRHFLHRSHTKIKYIE